MCCAVLRIDFRNEGSVGRSDFGAGMCKSVVFEGMNYVKLKHLNGAEDGNETEMYTLFIHRQNESSSALSQSYAIGSVRRKSRQVS